MAAIYILENMLNGKRYVGQTIDYEKRMRWHKQSSSDECIIDRAINKYGWDTFVKSVYYVPESLLDYFEIEIIRHLNTLTPYGYNLQTGGAYGRHSEETCKKISEALAGREFSEETKGKMRENHADVSGKMNPFYDKNHTEETRRIMRKNNKGEGNPNFGKTHTKESRKIMSEAQKGEKGSMFGRTHTDETKKKLRMAMLGKTPTDETKKKMRTAQISRRKREMKGLS